MPKVKKRFSASILSLILVGVTALVSKAITLPLDLTTNEMRCLVNLPSESCSRFYFTKAVQYYRENSFREAISSFDKAIEINNQWLNQGQRVLAYNNRGLAYLALGNYQKAAQDFERAKSLAPKNPDIYCNFGYLYREMGKEEESESNFQKAESLYDVQGSQDSCKFR